MYVTYDETGALTGAYMQDVVPAHQGICIPVSQADFDRWTSLQANAARDGVETRPAPPPAPPPVPQSVAMWRARTMLLNVKGQDLNPVVDQIIATLPEPHKSMAQMKWNYAGFVNRSDSLVLALMAQIPLTSDEADALFIGAEAL